MVNLDACTFEVCYDFMALINVPAREEHSGSVRSQLLYQLKPKACQQAVVKHWQLWKQGCMHHNSEYLNSRL